MNKVYVVLESLDNDHTNTYDKILGVFSSVDKCIKYLDENENIDEDSLDILSTNLEVTLESFSGYHIYQILEYELDEVK